MRLAAAVGAVAATLATPAAAGWTSFGDAGCDLTPGEHGTVAAVEDGLTLRLEDGTVVRLAGIGEPTALDGGADRQQAALEMQRRLAALVAGMAVELRYGLVRRDRYDRATAHVFVTGGAGDGWVQADMLTAGAAQVEGFADDRACLAMLMGFEQEARSRRRGLWRDGHYRPLWAGDPSLRRVDGLYGQVEGRVESVGSTERTIFLNFGRDWARDLTVTVRVGDAEKAGFAPSRFEALAGRRVRVRGWVTQRDGPLIRVDHPEQIEVLEDGNDGAGHDERPDG